MGFTKTKEKIKQKRFLENLINGVFKKVISGTLIFSMMIPQMLAPIAYSIGVASDAITNSSSTDEKSTDGASITLDKEFLEFTSFGQRQTLGYTIMPESSADKEVEFSVSNPESVTVTQGGEITWVKGTDPVIITVSLKNDSEIKAYCFASFEGDVENIVVEETKQDFEETNVINNELEKADEKLNSDEENSDENVSQVNSKNTDLENINILDDSGISLNNTPIKTFGASIRTTALSIGAPQIVQGLNFTAVLKADGTVWTWGDNTNGRLGDGTTVSKNYPVQVKGPLGQRIFNRYCSNISRTRTCYCA